MSDLEKKSKKELLDIISQLRDKLEDVKTVEKKQNALENNLNGYGISVVQDLDNKFKLVELSFNFNSKAAKIINIKEFITQGYEYALYDTKKTLVERVFNVKNLNHLKEKKNG